ncbi:phosphopyruvate hydratase [Candidatus Woesearchaeota archaeon]|nr:phosphopyruvate hydratase [Candidatus Woesearchaeota archaeon]
MRITKVWAREILDSRGNPTVEAELFTKTKRAREMVPSGASTGVHEALELRDGGKRYHSLGVQKAVSNVNTKIARKITGMDCTKQRQIDNTLIELDGTINKKKLGANAMLAVSLANARLASKSKKLPMYEYIGKNIVKNKSPCLLPIPFMNIINGGKHAATHLAFQEYMIVPAGKTFAESLRIGTEVYHTLKKIIAQKHGKSQTNVGDEGGFAPDLKKVEEPLRLIMQAAEKLGYRRKIKLALDIAATSFYSRKGYFVDDRYMNKYELMDLYKDLVRYYPIISIEDPFAEDDFEAFSEFMKEKRKSRSKKLRNLQVVGDDLTVTNKKRINKAVKLKACNALLLKVNQIGTLTEAIDSAKLAMKNRWKVMVSHRSGETEDHFISDLAVALNCGQIKAGAPCRGERTAKYNQLLRIEERLGRKARYAGRNLKKL